MGAAFPYVNANVDKDEAGSPPAFQRYVMLERRFTDEAGASHTLKIGVTGFVPPQIMQWDQQHLTGRVKVRDIPQTARELVPQMRAAGADVVVLIAHSGFERGETVFFAENTVARLAEVPGVTPSCSVTRTASSPAASSTATPRSTWPAAPSTACRP
jgi:2',3'-cyclic-nucleotide 2'-phosphodiesterase/3'-nucleotidase